MTIAYNSALGTVCIRPGRLAKQPNEKVLLPGVTYAIPNPHLLRVGYEPVSYTHLTLPTNREV